MNLDQIHRVYFIGIGGIGMSSLARWFSQRGIAVAGYDKTETALTKRLASEGMDIHYEDDLNLVPKEVLEDKAHSVIVFTPAVPKTHKELSFFQSGEYKLMKRSEMLGTISRSHWTVAVGGTHGKTTTSSMIAHILHETVGCSAFVGGIMTNYDSNLLIGAEDAPVVAEADEFDRSFHRLSPNYSIVTSVDPDHLDIYGDLKTMHEAFAEFLKKTNPEGKVLLHAKAAEIIKSHLTIPFSNYGIEMGDVQAQNVHVENGNFYFNYLGKQKIEKVELQVPGYHNVENAIAAITMALDFGIDAQKVKAAIAGYRGVKRRFEYIVRSKEVVYIDDYAHHPTEITALLKSVRSLYPAKMITAIFQPHLYSRTKDFQDGFAKSLELADDIILMDIYPAREEPIPGITSQVILEKINSTNKMICKRDRLIEVIAQKDPEVLLTVGAGDIDREVERIRDYYLNERKVEV
ncbi:MAG: UDP-N-acetylmuramate--L-alanine ligase [Cyclobacteriaceae bacterium]|nr:UDP-N-acetylmuramate--L-alanine ligase [Cyclobacteriaceae bacterium SS2]